MNWIKSLTDFFTLREWSLLDIDEESAGRIVSYFPDFPPNDYEKFSQVLNPQLANLKIANS